MLATETDAIFSTAPIPQLDLGSGLGQWEATEYEWITYLQSGFYYAGRGDGTVLEKYRGFDRGSLPYDRVREHLLQIDRDGFRPCLACIAERRGGDAPDGPHTCLRGATTRFVGMGLGMFTSAEWRSWRTEARGVRIGGGGKRAHVTEVCHACRAGRPMARTLHPLAVTTPGGRSQPHDLPWLHGAESELRRLDQLAMW